MSVSVAVTSGCSMKRYAVDRVGDMLAAGGSVYAADEDVDLVGDALPFSLKLLESLLVESPEHAGLLRAACRGFVLYARAYVHFEAERRADDDLLAARELKARSSRLYLRAHGYALRALERHHPGFAAALAEQPRAAAAMITSPEAGDMEPLYCAAASLALAISSSRTDVAMLARLAEVDELLERALALDESWRDGALHELMLQWIAARPGASDAASIRRHYARALELSQGRRAGLFVAYAEVVALPAQDRAQFEALLERALAIDAVADSDDRLLNRLAQRRARWLLQRTDALFL